MKLSIFLVSFVVNLFHFVISSEEQEKEKQLAEDEDGNAVED